MRTIPSLYGVMISADGMLPYVSRFQAPLYFPFTCTYSSFRGLLSSQADCVLRETSAVKAWLFGRFIINLTARFSLLVRALDFLFYLTWPLLLLFELFQHAIYVSPDLLEIFSFYNSMKKLILGLSRGFWRREPSPFRAVRSSGFTKKKEKKRKEKKIFTSACFTLTTKSAVNSPMALCMC